MNEQAVSIEQVSPDGGLSRQHMTAQSTAAQAEQDTTKPTHDDTSWIHDQLKRRSLPIEIAAFFCGHDRGETIAAMDAIASSLKGLVEEGVRKRIAGTAPVVNASGVNSSMVFRRAFGLKR